MARPSRLPDGPCEKLTVYCSPATAKILREGARAAGVSTGAVLDQLVLGSAPPRPAKAPRYDIIEKGGKEPPNPPPPPKSQASPPLPPGVSKGMPGPTKTVAHPGWRADATGVNVCTACGGRKTVVQGKPCPGEPS